MNDLLSSLADRLKETDPEAAKELERKARVIEDLHQKTQEISKSTSDQRKAQARDKVARIKQQLQALRALAAANPEAAARQVKRLAQELASAVREYASAGGGQVASGLGSTPALPSAPSSVSANAVSGSPAAMPTAATAVATPEDGAPQSDAPVPPTAAGPAASGGENTQTSDGSGENVEQEGHGAKESSSSPDEVRARTEAQVKKNQEDAAERKADAEFARDVDRIKAALKAILKQIKQQMEQDDKGGSDTAIDEAEKALRDVEHSQDAASTSTLVGTLSINVTV